MSRSPPMADSGSRLLALRARRDLVLGAYLELDAWLLVIEAESRFHSSNDNVSARR